MKTLFKNYVNTFKGLSREVWWLSLITLINRAGTMVIPFLSIYLKEDLQLTFSNVGWIMTCFSLGSLVGNWLGGKLTDRVGYYKIMVFSLLLSGFVFIGLQYFKTFAALCIGIFILMAVADMFRPAMYVALSAYSKPENKTRSATLIRLAINLGFSAGPAVGGLIITSIGYGGLFWVDGITCIFASIVLINVLNPKKTVEQDEIKVENPQSVFKDKAFLIFFFALIFFGIIFLQYFSIMPLYYREVHCLSKPLIGLLLGFNGFFIFLFEMPLIKWLEDNNYNKVSLILFGAALTGLSFIVLNLTSWTGIVFVGMLLMTIGEMIAFPFTNAFAMDRAKRGNPGEYMAMYGITFSIAGIFGFNAGLQIVGEIGFDHTWSIMTALAALCVVLLFILKNYLRKSEQT